MPYQSKLRMECSKAVESGGGGVRAEGREGVLKAGDLVREALVEDMVLPHLGLQHSWILWIGELGKVCRLLLSAQTPLFSAIFTEGARRRCAVS